MTSLDTTPIYLVMAQHPLIALDIAHAIEEEILGARVIVAPSLCQAMGLLAGIHKVDVAFIEAKDSVLAATPLLDALMLMGTRTILIGPETAIRCETLPMPFSIDDLAQKIHDGPARVA